MMPDGSEKTVYPDIMESRDRISTREWTGSWQP